MKELIHNGVMIPVSYQPQGFTLTLRGRPLKLTPIQEEMAVRFAQKFGSPYMEDRRFCANFMEDFAKALGINERITKEDFDWSQIVRWIEEERTRKATMPKDERKRLATERKLIREQNKEKYGWATVDGQRMELGNYAVEPPGIFMGRGCVAKDTIIKTEGGPAYVQELKEGGKIAVHVGSDMFYKKVESVDSQGIRPVYEVRTRTHAIEATENHPFLTLRVWRKRRRNENGTFSNQKYRPELRWVKLAELKRNDHVVVTKQYVTTGTSKYSKTPSRMVGNTIVTPKLARFLGYFVGDGWVQKGRKSQKTIYLAEGNIRHIRRYSQIAEEIFGVKPLIRKHKKGTSWRIAVGVTQFAGFLEQLGVTGCALTKRVPEWLFCVDDDLKVAFLKGYFDADGTLLRHSVKGIEYARIVAQSPNRRLIEDLRELCTAAGVKSSRITSAFRVGYSQGRLFQFGVSEHSSVKRLLDIGQRLWGRRTKDYFHQNLSLKSKWDWTNLRIADSRCFALERVLSIRIRPSIETYDVAVAGRRTPNFVANGFVVHNSHPKRGKWKAAVSTKDLELNLSPDAPTPSGEWKGRVWAPDEMWIARWTDKLSGKVKYVWFHDATPMKQERVQEKFDLAIELESKIDKVREHVAEGLGSEDVKRRKVATVAYLIDNFKIRVGDENETESGTVGATSLRSEHIKLHQSRQMVRLRFLGKDSILFDRELEVSPEAYKNLREFISNHDERIFSGITTEAIREFLSEAMPGLSPKVFRTFSATQLFRQKLEDSKVTKESADPEKKMALMEANEAVARLLNHKKAVPKRWQETYRKRLAMLNSLSGRKGKSIAKRKQSLRLRLAQMRLTKQWNLGTSLKNYIDPRVVVDFCKKVDYDWRTFYPKTLAVKFAWADNADHSKPRIGTSIPMP